MGFKRKRSQFQVIIELFDTELKNSSSHTSQLCATSHFTLMMSSVTKQFRKKWIITVVDVGHKQIACRCRPAAADSGRGAALGSCREWCWPCVGGERSHELFIIVEFVGNLRWNLYSTDHRTADARRLRSEMTSVIIIKCPRGRCSPIRTKQIICTDALISCKVASSCTVCMCSSHPEHSGSQTSTQRLAWLLVKSIFDHIMKRSPAELHAHTPLTDNDEASQICGCGCPSCDSVGIDMFFCFFPRRVESYPALPRVWLS